MWKKELNLLLVEPRGVRNMGHEVGERIVENDVGFMTKAVIGPIIFRRTPEQSWKLRFWL